MTRGSRRDSSLSIIYCKISIMGKDMINKNHKAFSEVQCDWQSSQ